MNPIPKPDLPIRILVVEDTLLNQRLLVRQLESLGYLADAVDDGQAALAAIDQTPYNLIFMDCQMPILDGYATTRAIRQREGSRRRIVIIATTASDIDGEENVYLEAGMDDCLAKPIMRDALSQKLTYWLAKMQPN